MAALTAQEITLELREAYRDADVHGISCDCCDRLTEEPQDRLALLWGEALYAIDRYRPGEVMTDETDESIDELAQNMVEAALVPALAAAREVMVHMAADALAGRVVRA